jgi:orotate phosphoribosyltransferase
LESLLPKRAEKVRIFFNLGNFNDGESLRELGKYYAQIIVNSNIEFDMIFGPAYKGIPLVSAIAIALMEHNINIPYSFNRKEIKDHGEGGIIIGSPIRGRVLIIDDVISAGTSINEAVSIINSNDGNVCGIIVAIDRQERGQSDMSATQEVSIKFNIPALSIITLDNIIEYLTSQNTFKSELKFIKEYRKEYGVS